MRTTSVIVMTRTLRLLLSRRKLISSPQAGWHILGKYRYSSAVRPLGGRTALLYRYFPKMCHPACGLEINLRRLKSNRNVRVMTMTEVVRIEGQRGAYTVTLKIRPRFVNENCTACGECAAAVSAEIPNPYNYGQGKIKAAHLPFALAYPQRYVLDPS